MESKGDILVWPFRKKSLTKDLSSSHTPGGTTPGPVDVPYDIKTYITEINTGLIDTNYMNSKFVKFLKVLDSDKEGTEVSAFKLSLKIDSTLRQFILNDGKDE